MAFTENVQARMAAFGFQTITVEDGTDMDAIGKAIEEAKADKEHPSFITIKTQIGYGCPAKQVLPMLTARLSAKKTSSL